MPRDEIPDDLPEEKSVWSLVHKGLPTMIQRAIKQTGGTHQSGLNSRLGFDLTGRLNDSLRHVGYGHQIGNDTVRHEVAVAVEGAFNHLNVTDDSNGTFKHNLIAKLDQRIELDAFGKALIKNTTENWRAKDFFHQMPMKDETLFVSLVCMGIIVPIIIITLFGVYIYKRKQETSQRRQEMLLREQPEFSLEERKPEEHKGNMEEDVADLDFRSSYQA